MEYLFAAVVLMGVLQVAAGAMRLGKFIRMVPHPVMLGFVNGLAIVIFLAQLGQFSAAVAHELRNPLAAISGSVPVDFEFEGLGGLPDDGSGPFRAVLEQAHVDSSEFPLSW